MSYLNSVTIIGFVGADPEQRQARNNNGSKFTVLSVATERSWKNTDDEWRRRPSGIACACSARGSPNTSRRRSRTEGRPPAQMQAAGKNLPEKNLSGTRHTLAFLKSDGSAGAMDYFNSWSVIGILLFGGTEASRPIKNLARPSSDSGFNGTSSLPCFPGQGLISENHPLSPTTIDTI